MFHVQNLNQEETWNGLHWQSNFSNASQDVVFDFEYFVQQQYVLKIRSLLMQQRLYARNQQLWALDLHPTKSVEYDLLSIEYVVHHITSIS